MSNLLLHGFLGALGSAQAQQVLSGLGISFVLEEDAFVTIVANRVDGDDEVRVANIIQNTHYPAGSHIVQWDGYGTGTVEKLEGTDRADWIKERIEPGQYRIRAITHQMGVKYLFSAYQGHNPTSYVGDPPWHTSAPTAGFLGEHGAQTDVLFKPNGTKANPGKPILIVSSTASEVYRNTGEFEFVGGELVKLLGTNPGHFITHLLTRDMGDSPDPLYFGYSSTDQSIGGNPQIRLRGLVAGANNNYAMTAGDIPIGALSGNQLQGFACWNGFLLHSHWLDGIIGVVDSKTGSYTTPGTYLGNISVADVRGLAFDDQRNLYVAHEDKITRHEWDPANPLVLSNSTTIVSGLDEPMYLLWHGSELYASHWGDLHCVRVYNPTTGALIRTIGPVGTPHTGKDYVPQMQRPRGFDIDGEGRLWIANHDMSPRSLQAWNADTGALIANLEGNTKYAGGITCDEQDPSRGFYSTPSNAAGSLNQSNSVLEFFIDWANPFNSRVKAVPLRIGRIDAWRMIDEPPDHMAPELPYRSPANDLFLVGWLQNGGGREPYTSLVWQMDEQQGILRLVSIIGRLGWFDNAFWWPFNEPAIKELWWPEDENLRMHAGKTVLSWYDSSGDGSVTVANTQLFCLHALGDIHAPNVDVRGGYIAPDFTWTDGRGLILKPTWVGGIPKYDLDNLHRIAFYPNGYQTNGDGTQTFAYVPWQDIAIKFGAMLTGYKVDWAPLNDVMTEANGKVLWEYPVQTSTSSSSANGFDRLPRWRGDIHRMMRQVSAPLEIEAGEAGTIIGLSEYHGSVPVITTDGFYLFDIGADSRVSGNWMDVMGEGPWAGKSTEGRGMRGESYFHSMFARRQNGVQQIIFQGGGDSNMFEVTGWETVKRVDLGTYTITEDHLAGLPATQTIPVPSQIQDNSMTVPVNVTRTVDGSDADWGELVTIDQAKGISGGIASDGTTLWAIWKSSQNILNNPGTPPLQEVFRWGGGFDLYVADVAATEAGNNWGRGQPHQVPNPTAPRAHAEGDCRVFVTEIGGVLRAWLFERVNADTTNQYVYSSPLGSVTFDRVVEITAEVTIARSEGNVEIGIPLSVLPITVGGKSVLGDLGVVIGNGDTAVDRTHWNNKAKVSVNDLPEEAEFWTAHMGVLNYVEV